MPAGGKHLSPHCAAQTGGHTAPEPFHVVGSVSSIHKHQCDPARCATATQQSTGPAPTCVVDGSQKLRPTVIASVKATRWFVTLVHMQLSCAHLLNQAPCSRHRPCLKNGLVRWCSRVRQRQQELLGRCSNKEAVQSTAASALSAGEGDHSRHSWGAPDQPGATRGCKPAVHLAQHSTRTAALLHV